MYCRIRLAAVAGLLAAAIALLFIYHYHRRPASTQSYSYAIVVPRVGDNAVVDLEILKEGRSRVSPSGEFHRLTPDDYRHIQLVIRCVGVRGKECEFAVYYRSKGAPDRIAYFVTVDYSANRIEKRVVVKDTDGKRVPFAERVDGNPVPFDCFLSYGKEYLERSGMVDARLGARSGLIHRIHYRSDPYWNVTLELSQKGNRASAGRLFRAQCWTSGEWLWFDCGGDDGGRSWHAKRISITGAQSPASSK
jgi:hypothetical protein